MDCTIQNVWINLMCWDFFCALSHYHNLEISNKSFANLYKCNVKLVNYKLKTNNYNILQYFKLNLWPKRLSIKHNISVASCFNLYTTTYLRTAYFQQLVL